MGYRLRDTLGRPTGIHGLLGYKAHIQESPSIYGPHPLSHSHSGNPRKHPPFAAPGAPGIKPPLLESPTGSLGLPGSHFLNLYHYKVSMTNHESRVIRAVNFSPAAFAHLKTCQNHFQLQANQSEPGRTVTNSETLGRILHAHAQLGLVAAKRGMQVQELCSALAFGDLAVSAQAPRAL